MPLFTQLADENPRRSDALRERPRLARAQAQYRKAAVLAAEEFGVDLRDMLSARRRRGKVAEARKLAAYLAVVTFELSRRQVARLTGRNAMVIVRMCAAVEDAREDDAIDKRISELEARLKR